MEEDISGSILSAGQIFTKKAKRKNRQKEPSSILSTRGGIVWQDTDPRQSVRRVELASQTPRAMGTPLERMKMGPVKILRDALHEKIM